MRRVVYSLIPIFIMSVVLYGWRSLVTTITVFVTGILSEYIFTRKQGKKISEAVLVTCGLYALSMPPAVPQWVAAVGIAFGVVFAKNMYGGFGRNVFNPAIAGRLFVYVTFPQQLQRTFIPPWRPGMPWNFGLSSVVDTTTGATPLITIKEGVAPDLLDHFLGFRIGSMGEASAILIVAAGIYLIVTKTANWKIMLATLLGFSAVIWGLNLGGIAPLGATEPFGLVESLLSGSILYIVVFMVTDPVSAPKKPGAQWTYGILIGGLTATIRVFSLFPEGVSFAILLGNTFASLLDEWFPAAKKKKKKKAVVASVQKSKEWSQKAV